MPRLPSKRAVALFVLALVAGCSCADRKPEGPERWARRFLPFEDRWRREAEIPSEPQQTPAMATLPEEANASRRASV